MHLLSWVVLYDTRGGFVKSPECINALLFLCADLYFTTITQIQDLTIHRLVNYSTITTIQDSTIQLQQYKIIIILYSTLLMIILDSITELLPDTTNTCHHLPLINNSDLRALEWDDLSMFQFNQNPKFKSSLRYVTVLNLLTV